ncbi:MAG TPA: hypothetical protein VLT36_03180 [Candidatus Dormibacteraeota bacterium]|nr:hypothetical protein [Candidatus Dormibacteraeota bacterium]
MRSGLSQLFCLGLILCVTPPALSANFTPLPLTTNSFNADVIVEKAAPAPTAPVTTASMEAGITNTGFAFYERGYNSNAPTTGLPAAGAIVTSELSGDYSFLFAPTYKTNNVILLDSNLTSASALVSTPSSYARLTFLVAGGNGGGSVQFVIRHQDATTETGSLTISDWMSLNPAAFTPYGIIDVGTFAVAHMNDDHPRLYSRDINLGNSNSPVTRIDFNYLSGAAHLVVFAVSGSISGTDPFTPLTISGYNADIVVEAAAVHPGSLPGGITSATVERGSVNSGRTLYEQGYYTLAPLTGLPAAGSTLTNATAPDHRYLLAPSYTNNNAAVVDAAGASAVLTTQSPADYTAISLLATAGHGPTTNTCVVQHANGVSETNNFVVPDWLDTAGAAFTANGRVNVGTKAIDLVNAGTPKLFGIDIALANSSSPVTNIVLNFIGGGSDAHTVVLAVSVSTGAVSNPAAVLTISLNNPGTFALTTSQPSRLQSATDLKGTNTVWTDEGTISGTVNRSLATNGEAKFYRVVGP